VFDYFIALKAFWEELYNFRPWLLATVVFSPNGAFFFHIYVNGQKQKKLQKWAILGQIVNGVGNIN